MTVETSQWFGPEAGWRTEPSGAHSGASLVIVFGSSQLLESPEAAAAVAAHYPAAVITGCSTAGEICDLDVDDDSLTVCALELERTRVKQVSLPLEGVEESQGVGRALVAALRGEGLKHILLFSDGLNVHGDKLAQGMTEGLPEGVAVTGGLAGDGEQFEKTMVFTELGAKSSYVSAIGFYGAGIEVGHGTSGGWSPFGPVRLITNADNALLRDLDHRPALELYREYVGEDVLTSSDVPLLYPLLVRKDLDDEGAVRGVLALRDGCLLFAGDMPLGSYASLLRTSHENLIQGAEEAAEACLKGASGDAPELAILISCINRRRILKQRVEEEIEAVQDVFGDDTKIVGFYSYGEIASNESKTTCVLHNQTMTITTLRECA